MLGQVGLWIKVDEQNLVSHFRELSAYCNRSSRFADAPFVVGNSNHATRALLSGC